MARNRLLPVLMLVYGAASLAHFIHNAVYVGAYPNLPPWITPQVIYASWCVIAAVGVLGYWLYRAISRPLGLVVIAMYALLGFGGLDHYAIAPVAAHTIAMNATILAEVFTASALLIYLAVAARENTG